jgi:hypothetical protein
MHFIYSFIYLHLIHPFIWLTNGLTCIFYFNRCIIFIVFLVGWDWVSPIGTAATIGLLYQPQMTDDGDYGATGGMKIGRGNRSTRRKPVPVLLCQPQIPHDQTRARTRAAAVGSQRLTAWDMPWPNRCITSATYPWFDWFSCRFAFAAAE